MYGQKDMDPCYTAGFSRAAGDIAACNARLDGSYDPVSSSSVRDLITKKWDGKPMLNFLKAVQAAADSSGHSDQTSDAK
jgi:hypothetical protein